MHFDSNYSEKLDEEQFDVHGYLTLKDETHTVILHAG